MQYPRQKKFKDDNYIEVTDDEDGRDSDGGKDDDEKGRVDGWERVANTHFSKWQFPE